MFCSSELRAQQRRKDAGPCELEVEQTVFAADRTVRVTAGSGFCGMQTVHCAYAFFTRIRLFGTGRGPSGLSPQRFAGVLAVTDNNAKATTTSLNVAM
jgi:hypothetical protein